MLSPSNTQGAAIRLVQALLDRMGDRGLAGAGKADEPHDGTLVAVQNLTALLGRFGAFRR